MYLELILAFISGLLVKIVDDIEDKKKRSKISNFIKWPFAIAYGIMIGYIISKASFSMIFLGALLAQVIALKIDNTPHMIGFLLAIISSAYFGLPDFIYLPFSLFLVTAYLDELTLFGFWKIFVEYRLFLIIAAAVFVLVSRIDYFIGIMVFDVGYFIAKNLDEKYNWMVN